MLNDIARLLSDSEDINTGDSRQPAEKLSRQEIDRILDDAWENCLSDTEAAVRNTERALQASLTANYPMGMATAFRNRAYIHMVGSRYKEGIADARQSIRLIGDEDATVAGTAWDTLALCYHYLGSYRTATEATYKSLSLFEKAGYERGIAWAHHNLGMINNGIGDLEKAASEYEISLAAFRELDYEYGISRIITLLSEIYRNKGDYGESLACLEKDPAKPKPGDGGAQAVRYFLNLGITSRLTGNLEDAQAALNSALGILKKDKIGDLEGTALYEYALLQKDLGKPEEARDSLVSALKICRETLSRPIELKVLRALADTCESKGHFEAALKHFRNYDRLARELTDSESLQRIKDLESRREIEMAEREKDYHRRLRNETEKILGQVLPARIVEELKTNGKVLPRSIPSATVIFTDFVGFTAMASRTDAGDLVKELDYCFSGFDGIVTDLGIEKLKTIGDGYMAVAGAMDDGEDHPQRAVRAGLRIREFMRQYAREREEAGRQFWKVRIGIHTGPIIAGVIGSNKFAYDVWGDTVNIASRMESGGRVGEVNISEGLRDLVKNDFRCETSLSIDAKGKGLLPTYTVRGF